MRLEQSIDLCPECDSKIEYFQMYQKSGCMRCVEKELERISKDGIAKRLSNEVVQFSLSINSSELATHILANARNFPGVSLEFETRKQIAFAAVLHKVSSEELVRQVVYEDKSLQKLLPIRSCMER